MQRAGGRSHENLRLCQADDGSRGGRGRRRARRRLSRRRHESARSDEGRRDAGPIGSSTSRIFPASTGSKTLRTAACASARWSATPTLPTIAISPGAFRPLPRRCCPEPRRSCAMRRPSAATSCSGRAAPISMTSASACNKRNPGAGCDARGGDNRLHAILGWSESCIATHPSDFCVALVALDAVVEIEGNAGRREIPLEAFHRLPGDTPDRETVLEPGEMIVARASARRGRAFCRPCALSQSS